MVMYLLNKILVLITIFILWFAILTLNVLVMIRDKKINFTDKL